MRVKSGVQGIPVNPPYPSLVATGCLSAFCGEHLSACVWSVLVHGVSGLSIQFCLIVAKLLCHCIIRAVDFLEYSQVHVLFLYLILL